MPPTISAMASANHQNPAGRMSARIITTPANMTSQPIAGPLLRLRLPKINHPLRTTHYTQGACTMFLFLLPFLILGAYLVQSAIALVSAAGNFALIKRLPHRTLRLFAVGRSRLKAALPYVRLKLRESVLQLILGNRRHLLHVEGGEARRIRAVASGHRGRFQRDGLCACRGQAFR